MSSVETPDGAPELRKKKRAGWRRYAFAGVGAAIVIVTFAFALPKIADYREVWGVVKTLTWEWVRRADRRDGAQPRHLRAAVDGDAARPALPPGVRDDAGVDGALDHRPRRSGGRDGRLVGDAPRLGLPHR